MNGLGFVLPRPYSGRGLHVASQALHPNCAQTNQCVHGGVETGECFGQVIPEPLLPRLLLPQTASSHWACRREKSEDEHGAERF